MGSKRAVIVGLAQPLLDIIAEVPASLLAQYGLNSDDQIMAKSDELLHFHQTILGLQGVQARTGGSVQNTLKILKLVGGSEVVCRVLGSVGDDDCGQLLLKAARNDGIEALYQVRENSETGICVALVNGENRQFRSMVTKLNASAYFDQAFVASNWAQIAEASLIYASGFILSAAPAQVMKIATKLREKPFAFNLSNIYIPKSNKSLIEGIMPYVDLVFGNRAEYCAFCSPDCPRLPNEDRTAHSKRILEFLDRKYGSLARPLTLVLTQSADPVVVRSKSTTLTFGVKPVEFIADTIGVGDAFVGGFLLGFAKNDQIGDCVRRGNEAARAVIREVGCSMPAAPVWSTTSGFE